MNHRHIFYKTRSSALQIKTVKLHQIKLGKCFATYFAKIPGKKTNSLICKSVGFIPCWLVVKREERLVVRPALTTLEAPSVPTLLTLRIFRVQLWVAWRREKKRARRPISENVDDDWLAAGPESVPIRFPAAYEIPICKDMPRSFPGHLFVVP